MRKKHSLRERINAMKYIIKTSRKYHTLQKRYQPILELGHDFNSYYWQKLFLLYYFLLSM